MERKIRVLNLYAGIGGNRKAWDNDKVEVTAVEYKKEIADIYKDHFPNDEVIVGDAHQYLEENFYKYDFIWSSPPCPSHSRVRLTAVASGQNKPIFPNMKLYEEILFLSKYFKGKWLVENVKAWYEPLVKPKEVGNHWYWSNFNISNIKSHNREHDSSIEVLQKRKGFDLSKYKKLKTDKKLLLRNCVEYNESKHIWDSAFNKDNGILSFTNK